MSRPATKYLPLARALRAQPGDEVTLSFAAIEVLLGAPLPASATGPRFWANAQSGSAQAQAWHGAGWRVAGVNVGLRQVTFVRREGTP